MAGRRPKPTAVKQLAGNPGKRALNQQEPKPRSKRPKMPAEFRGTRKEFHWRRLTRELGGMQVLSSADEFALAQLCDALFEYENAQQKLDEQGEVFFTEKGHPVPSPYEGKKNKSRAAIMKILIEFGLTPASRSRIQLPEGKAVDEFAVFLRRKPGD